MYHFHTEVFKKYFSHIESTWKYFLWLIMLIISKADKNKDFKTSIILVSLKFIKIASALRLKAFSGPPVPTRQKPQVLNTPDKELWDLFPCPGLELLFFLIHFILWQPQTCCRFQYSSHRLLLFIFPSRLNAPCPSPSWPSCQGMLPLKPGCAPVPACVMVIYINVR